MSHIYALAVVATALNATQQAQISQAFKDLPVNADGNPANDVHSRMRLDGQAWIVEGYFTSTPTKAQVVQLIANHTGLSTTTVSNNLTLSLFSGADRETSRQAALAYLTSNAAAWET